MNYKVEVVLLIGSAIWMILSWVSPLTEQPEYWFARSGAIMILLSAIIEYRFSNHTFSKIKQTIQIAILTKKPINVYISNEQENIAKVAHSFIVIGTLVWGYGDLLYKYLVP